MKKWSENFLRACGGLFSLWRHWKPFKNFLKTSMFWKNDPKIILRAVGFFSKKWSFDFFESGRSKRGGGSKIYFTINAQFGYTYSTFAWSTGLLPCSTCAETYNFCLVGSTMPESSAEAQHLVLYGKVSFLPALDVTVTNVYSISLSNSMMYW